MGLADDVASLNPKNRDRAEIGRRRRAAPCPHRLCAPHRPRLRAVGRHPRRPEALQHRRGAAAAAAGQAGPARHREEDPQGQAQECRGRRLAGQPSQHADPDRRAAARDPPAGASAHPRPLRSPGQGSAMAAGATNVPRPGHRQPAASATGSAAAASATARAAAEAAAAAAAAPARSAAASPIPIFRTMCAAGGTVHLRFTVAPTGRVSDCAVTRSSGSRILDNLTCRLIIARFRYRPARNAEGQAIASTVIGEHVWEDEPPPPGHLDRAGHRGANGLKAILRSCTRRAQLPHSTPRRFGLAGRRDRDHIAAHDRPPAHPASRHRRHARRAAPAEADAASPARRRASRRDHLGRLGHRRPSRRRPRRGRADRRAPLCLRHAATTG